MTDTLRQLSEALNQLIESLSDKGLDNLSEEEYRMYLTCMRLKRELIEQNGENE